MAMFVDRILKILYNVIDIQFIYVLESRVVECSMESFMHKHIYIGFGPLISSQIFVHKAIH